MNFKKYQSVLGFSVIVLGFAFAPHFAHDAHATALTTLSGRDLTIGSMGTDVADLQGILSEQGYLNIPVGVAPGYFGPLTKVALAQYQASIGVSPAVGYFGPITRARMVNVFTMKGWMALLARENS